MRRRAEPCATVSPALELGPDDSPFDPSPSRDHRGRWGGELKSVVWVRPEVVIRVESAGWSRDGMVRQAAFKGVEEGRDPLSVTREVAVETTSAVKAAEAAAPEQGSPAHLRREIPTSRSSMLEEAISVAEEPTPAHLHREIPTSPRRTRSNRPTAMAGSTAFPALLVAPAELGALAALGREGVWAVGGQELKLTNLDKPLFRPATDDPADSPITKRDLIRYFARIAPAMLPHLANRPLNLQRFPNGADAPGFWQKDIPGTAPGGSRVGASKAWTAAPTAAPTSTSSPMAWRPCAGSATRPASRSTPGPAGCRRHGAPPSR